MKVLKYEDFLETMQYTVLKNAERIAKEEEKNRKKQTPKTDKPESKTRIESGGQVQTAQGQAQSQSPQGQVQTAQGQAQSQSPQGQSQMEEEDGEDY